MCYAYARSKQKVREEVEPLENTNGNIISDGFQLAEVLNEFSFLPQNASAHFQFQLNNSSEICQII